MANIQDAIHEYLATREESLRGAVVRGVEVAWHHDSVSTFTMGGIVRHAGLAEDEFRKLLQGLTAQLTRNDR